MCLIGIFHDAHYPSFFLHCCQAHSSVAFTCVGQVGACCDVGHYRVEAGTAGGDVRVEVDVGESKGAVDGGGGEEGEEADDENAGEEKQGGDQHRYLQLASSRLSVRAQDSRCEDREGKLKKVRWQEHELHFYVTFEHEGKDRDGCDGID